MLDSALQLELSIAVLILEEGQIEGFSRLPAE